jgi:glycosyltransferase involved in cell wall biosynthesis/SAM-dependent methyltransferase
MNLSLAWVTPFSSASDISAFSYNLLGEFSRVANIIGARISVFVNENGPRYWSPLPTVALSGTEMDREMLLGFDFVVFNIGNNLPNHEHINRLALDLPAVIIVHDLVMQHAIAGMLSLGDRNGVGRSDVYSLLMGAFYGARGLDAVAQSRLCVRDAPLLYAPWETLEVTAFPLVEPFIDTAAAVVLHSAHAEMALRLPVGTPMLRLALPWDQKPSPTDGELRDWAIRTRTTIQCSIVCIGGIRRDKCLDQVILAFAHSEDLRAGASLTIAGHAEETAYLATLERLVTQFGLGRWITFELSASNDRLHQIKLAADVFVNLRCPNTESASGSLTEQLNAGKPVVVYPSGAYLEVDADAVIRVDRAGGVACLAAALEGAVRDPEARVRIGAAGRAFVRRIGRADYVSRLWDFLCANRELLEVRKACTAGRRAIPSVTPEAVRPEWLSGVNHARRLFAGLRGNRLALEVLPFQSWDDALLAAYVAVGVFGQAPGSSLEAVLKAGLPGADRADWYQAAAEAHLVWRMTEEPDLLAGVIPRGADVPMLLPRAWQLLAALGRWSLVRCCYVGLLGRGAHQDEIVWHAIHPVNAMLGDVVEAFLGSPAFQTRQTSPDAVLALRQGLQATEVPIAAFTVLPQDATILFTTAQPRCIDYLAPGWYELEEEGTWSRTSDATLLFGIASPSAAFQLTVTGRLIDAPGAARTLRVHVDGRQALSCLVESAGWLTLSVSIDHTPDAPSAHVVRFDCQYTVSPRDVGHGEDKRPLGFCLRSIVLMPDLAGKAMPPAREVRIISAGAGDQADFVAAGLDLFDRHVAAMRGAAAGRDFDAAYYSKHRARFVKTLAFIPPAARGGRALEIGATAFLQVALKAVFRYAEIVGTESSTLIEHKIYRKQIEAAEINTRNLTVSIDIESDIFPFPDASFDLVLCCEVIEHLDVDPMFMLAEINRICEAQGRLVLTTPNCCSARNLWQIARGFRPHFFMQYARNRSPYRHNFEYDIHALTILLQAAGFTIETLETHDVFEPPLPEAQAFIQRTGVPATFRGDDIFILARRTGPVSNRWPEAMYV